MMVLIMLLRKYLSTLAGVGVGSAHAPFEGHNNGSSFGLRGLPSLLRCEKLEVRKL